MKKIKTWIFSLAAICITFTACEYDKTPLDEEIVGENVGAVLTTVSTSGGTINKLNPSESNIETKVLFNDFKENNTIESVDIFILFADTTPVNNQVIKLDEVLITTLTPNDFTVGSSGFPENTFTINGQAILDALKLNSNQIDGGDLFVLRYVLKLTDGRSFSAADTGTNVRTTSHVAPFRYSSVVVCFKTPVPGEYELVMNDVYGDGWNGGSITISIDGKETVYTCSGFTTTEKITIPIGAKRLLFSYKAGDWEGENTYTFKDPNGITLLSDGSGDGSRTNGPAEGEQFNTCD